MSKTELLEILLCRGDQVEIREGRLAIVAASGLPVPDDWLDEKAGEIIQDIINQLGLNAYIYDGFTTGCYGGQRYPGVCLQFINLLTGESAYAVFNAELHRKRNTSHGKKGDSLPGKQFRVNKGHAFTKFWLRSGLSLPKRLSALHDYMGNLKDILFTAVRSQGGRLNCQSITPLNVTDQQLRESIGVIELSDMPQTNTGHHPYNRLTRLPDNNISEGQTLQGFQDVSNTGDLNYGLSSQGGAVSRGVVIPINACKKPVDQTTEEWLADYAK